jgi:hypothetical protein
MNFARRHVAFVGIAWALVAAVTTAQDRPLPDAREFLTEVKKRLQPDDSLQQQYAYVETRRELKLDRNGRTTEESVKVIESYPGLPGEEDRWERVIEIDGKPVSQKALAEQDRDRQEKAQSFATRLARQSPKDRAQAAREEDKERQRIAKIIADIDLAYEIRMRGRETIDGHDTIQFSLTPRPKAAPATREGRLMRHFVVNAWVSETDYELVRVTAEAISTLSFGYGILARIHEGSRFAFERRKVNGEVWLPARTTYSGSARVGLVRVLRRTGISEFSSYRRFSVDASTTYKTPAH